MVYLRDCWYAAAWADEVSRKPFGRIILDESITFYRKEDGSPVALASRCPHRFAPLHYGDVVGDDIRCAYHALQFNAAGKCTHNPHDPTKRPPPISVKSYPVVEKDSLLWIWMDDVSGDPIGEPTDEYSYLQSEKYAGPKGYLHVDCDYRLVIDNLLDHAHVTHLHAKSLASDGMTSAKTEIRTEGNTVFADRWAPDGAPSAFFNAMFEQPGKNVDHWANVRWEAPSSLTVDAGVTGVGKPIDEGIRFKTAHIVTPESSSSCHYFWSGARNFKLEDSKLTETIGETLQNIFIQEDQWILEGQQSMMRHQDFWSLKPALLAGDEAAAKVRRHLDSMIARQALA